MRRQVFVLALLLVAISLTVTGELLLKSGVDRVGAFTPSLPVIWRTFTEWRVLLGFTFIFGGSLFWLGVISRVDFSYAYPLLGLSYVVSLLPAWLLLREEIPLNRILGAIIICLGVIVVTRK